jgi:hypothetical protein
MTYWLKLMHWDEPEKHDDWTDISDIADPPGRTSSRWTERPQPSDGELYPAYGPKYQIDDLLVVYFTGLQTCPAILRVTGEPRWDPSLVDKDDWRESEGDRWGVVTPVEVIHSVNQPQDGPTLAAIDVEAASITQKSHIKLNQSQYDEAEKLITGRSPSRGEHAGQSHTSVVPIGQGQVEGYYTSARQQVERAVRREYRLVRDYETYLVRQGNIVGQNQTRVPGTSERIYSDCFNVTRHQLIEAKASTDRKDVRMAIGQLADYARFIHPAPDRAMLLPAKPRRDLLDLLYSQGISAIWREGHGFDDNAAGRFT